jgi:hypothetical protein
LLAVVFLCVFCSVEAKCLCALLEFLCHELERPGMFGTQTKCYIVV